MLNHPQPISPEEWDEIAALPIVRECRWLAEGESGQGLSLRACGARFSPAATGMSPEGARGHPPRRVSSGAVRIAADEHTARIVHASLAPDALTTRSLERAPRESG